jgi:4-aminobutyrate aminotransferase
MALPQLPEIRTTLPGPNAARVVAADARWVSPSYTRSYPLVARRGEGAMIEDVDGNVFLDFNAGIAVASTGHCHPEVVAAIHSQSSALIHLSGTDYYYALLPELAERIAQWIPYGSEWKAYFSNSGTEAIEAAMKLARYHTGRDEFIAFHGGFHGRTMGALSLTASKPIQRHRFGPLVPGVSHVPYPNSYRMGSDAAVDVIDHIRKVLFKTTVNPDQVAAIVVEPVLGEGGYVVPPPDFFPRLQALAREHGILLVADEVQSGMGRTGKMFAFEHFGFEPDIIALAKGVASGMPLGMTMAPSTVMDWKPGAHASTFGGNPVSLAAARATLDLLGQGLIENSARMGAVLLEGARELQVRHRVLGDVRGLGLMVGLEFVRDPESREPAPDLRDAVVNACFRQGLIVLGAGASTLRLSPPLVVNEDQCRFALRTLDQAITSSL